MIIGLSGAAGCGKSTAAQWLVNYEGFIELSFAKPLKAAVADIFGFTNDQLYHPVCKEQIDTYWHKSPREIMQIVGDGFRNLIDKDIWVTSLKRVIESPVYRGRDIVIADVRYPNECKFIRQIGGVCVCIKRAAPSLLDSRLQKHPSETALDDMVFEHVLENDGNLTDLYVKLNTLLEMINNED